VTRIAELKEKSLKTLAKRLLARSGSEMSSATNNEMEAALLRLNPQLSRIRELPKGIGILVPDEFVLAPGESVTPSRRAGDELLRQAEQAASSFRAVLKEQVARSAEETERVQRWLKSAEAKEFVRRSPALEEMFAKAASESKALPKDRGAALSAEDKSLNKVLAHLQSFRSAWPE
jgi:hypothetical protein